MNKIILKKLSISLEIDLKLLESIIYTEDKRFFSHFGIDILRICKALIINMKNMKIKQGASTITQQIFDIMKQKQSLKYERPRTVLRKIMQIIFALSYEIKYSKEEILKYYLLNVYLGYNIFGFRKASIFYFNKNANKLSKEEIIFLVNRIKYPNLHKNYISQ